VILILHSETQFVILSWKQNLVLNDFGVGFLKDFNQNFNKFWMSFEQILNRF